MHLSPTAQAWYGDTNWILQQDNASCHTSAISRQAIAEMGIHLLPWPSNSPDMNCIENAWSLLKRKVYERGSGRTKEDVIFCALDIWNNDNQFRDSCIQLVHSMPRRIHALSKARGGFTTY
jgi:hypothetical protein